MASRVRKTLSLRRDFQAQRSLTRRQTTLHTTTVKKSFTVMDAMLHIYILKLKLETLHKECLDLMAIKTKYLDLIKRLSIPKDEVKVEKIEEGFHVRVKCEKEDDTLVSILEAFEEIGIDIMEAKVSCNDYFAMEAIVAHRGAHNQECKVDDVSHDTGNHQGHSEARLIKPQLMKLISNYICGGNIICYEDIN